MSNSSLVSYTKISPNRTSPRNSKIDRISIHCVAGHATLQGLGSIFAPTSRKASSNYGVDDNGKVGMYCQEKDRSWCTSDSKNDHSAVTIEVASDSFAPYKVTDKALQGTIKLVADIAKRNGIKKILWKNDKNAKYKPGTTNLTVHRWFSNTACPGDYLMGKMKYIADEANKILNGSSSGSSSSTPDKRKDLVLDGKWGKAVTTDLQKWLSTTVDGKVSNQPDSNRRYAPRCYTTSWEWKKSNYSAGSSVIKALQKKVGIKGKEIDGFAGTGTAKATQKYLKVPQTGKWDKTTVLALQKLLNTKLK